MPEPKKKTPKATFDAQVDSLLEGLRLTDAMLPAAPRAHKPADGKGSKPGRASAIQQPEPDVVNKLIDFIKSI